MKHLSLSLSLSFERREETGAIKRKGGGDKVVCGGPLLSSDRDYHGRSVGAAHRFGITMDVALEQHLVLGYHGRSVEQHTAFCHGRWSSTPLWGTMDVALEQHTALGLPWT